LSFLGPLLGFLLAFVASLVLPGLAFLGGRRGAWSHPLRVFALMLTSAASWILWSTGTLTLRAPATPTQHSMFEGLDTLLVWLGFGVAHLTGLALFLWLALRDTRKSLSLD